MIWEKNYHDWLWQFPLLWSILQLKKEVSEDHFNDIQPFYVCMALEFSFKSKWRKKLSPEMETKIQTEKKKFYASLRKRVTQFCHLKIRWYADT